ncbi:Hypothetical protein CAP_7679 [Chondromyces apiculatus DSM 436]|uniref:Integrase n=1 Tax=Chondromyces apiculatus DSM 436 TaxID=1192034 RepID=A0A017T016_9BACT|nr:Hypothetical protein CAP_7679 [Chondromyces apiculatus DSM 436]
MGGGAGDDGVLAPRLAPTSPERDPARMYLLSLSSQESRRSQASALRVVARLFGHETSTMPWEHLRLQHTRVLRATLARTKAPKTANRYLTAVREVLRWAARLGLMSRDDLESAIDFPAVRGSRLPSGRAVTVVEVQALFATARSDHRRRRGARDAAIVALIFGGGLRRAEAARLTVGAWQGGAVRVRGKGDKEREVPLPGPAREAIERWMGLRGRAPGPLVDDLDQRGKALTPDAIHEALHRLARRAGVKPFGSHDGRRYFATQLLRAGVQLRHVQDLMGHASPAQTAKYDRASADDRARSVELLPLPY